MPTGTHDISSLLAANNQSVAEFGTDNVAAILAADRAVHNRIASELTADLAEETTDRQRASGVSSTGTMLEVDEYGRAPTQKAGVPVTLGFPLRLYQWPVGWTRRYLLRATPKDLAIAQQNAQVAHLRTLVREIKKSFFLSANYTVADRLTDNVSLAVKRLANADSMSIPNGPNGETFDASTHQHYTAEASLTAAGLLASINTVIEHGVSGVVRTAISATNETAVRALSGFVEAQDPRVINATTADTARDSLALFDPGNRLIGYFGSSQVWVKPWAIASYAVTYDTGPAMRPLVKRVSNEAALRGLRLAAEIEAHPLHAEFQEDEFGFAVMNRTKMAVHYFGGASYTDPTIT